MKSQQREAFTGTSKRVDFLQLSMHVLQLLKALQRVENSRGLEIYCVTEISSGFVCLEEPRFRVQ